nr:TfuA-like protein [Synechococcus sp. AH-603-L18]
MKSCLFIGPSIPKDVDLSMFNIFPPIKAGDIYRIITHGYDRIGIVDGVFHGEPSIWHREILNAVDEGIEVLGSSSMGALRASEMDTLGVKGIGKVYKWYQENRINGDDEVALSHLPIKPYNPMTIPLVDIRNILIEVLSMKIETEEHIRIIKTCRTVPYWNRTNKTIRMALEKSKHEKNLIDILQEKLSTIESIKQQDARELIALMKSKTERNEKFKCKAADIKQNLLSINLYGDFALKSRQCENKEEKSEKNKSEQNIISNSNYTRNMYVHSLISYWIEDSKDEIIHKEAIQKTRTEMQKICESRIYLKRKEDIRLTMEEIEYFTYLSNYYHQMIKKNIKTVEVNSKKQANIYKNNNPAKDNIKPSFRQILKSNNEDTSLEIISQEIQLVEQIFQYYKTDLRNLKEIYLKIFTNSIVQELDLTLQSYIYAGTFGIRSLGCSDSVQNAHLFKYIEYTKFADSLAI